jgi:hypothetical protein
MIVTAKCTKDAWDSKQCILFEAGQTYQVDTSWDVCQLKRYSTRTGRCEGYVLEYNRAAVEVENA